MAASAGARELLLGMKSAGGGIVAGERADGGAERKRVEYAEAQWPKRQRRGRRRDAQKERRTRCCVLHSCPVEIFGRAAAEAAPQSLSAEPCTWRRRAVARASTAWTHRDRQRRQLGIWGRHASRRWRCAGGRPPRTSPAQRSPATWPPSAARALRTTVGGPIRRRLHHASRASQGMLSLRCPAAL
jgi:hypothetical protein